MNAKIYETKHAVAHLTTWSTQSHYGVPVLEITLPDGSETDYGPSDFLPSGITAGRMVELCIDGGHGSIPMTKEVLEAAQRYLRV